VISFEFDRKSPVIILKNPLSGRLETVLLGTSLVFGCSGGGEPLVPRLEGDGCASHSAVQPLNIPDCLLSRGIIDQADRDSSTRLLQGAMARVELFRSVRSADNLERAARIARSLDQVATMHQRGLLDDSARFHRMMDVVSVAIEIAEERAVISAGRVRPDATPHLIWYSYDKIGVFFQPVTTSRQVASVLPSASVPTDTLLAIADHLYRYALWRDRDGRRFPVWEYLFPWSAGGVRLDPPWISAMSQGLVMSIFAEAHRRTGLPLWRTRAYEAFSSFQVSWSDGGVRLDDTTHGYWWEEFDPRIRIWNGSVQALVGVGFVWTVTQDTAVKRVFDRGIESLKYYTPQYDTGRWTLYSLTQGHNTVAYHNYHVELLDVLFSQTGDPWFRTTADRWRSYTPPPGIR